MKILGIPVLPLALLLVCSRVLMGGITLYAMRPATIYHDSSRMSPSYF